MLAAGSDSKLHDTVLIGAGFCTWNRYGKHLGVRKAEEHEYEHEHEHEPVGRMLREQGYCPQKALVTSMIARTRSLASCHPPRHTTLEGDEHPHFAER